MSAKYELAQVNIGRLHAPVDHPMIKDFFDNLDPINALAEASPGFVWRLKGEGNNATDLQPFEDPLMAINMSVWTDIPSLGALSIAAATSSSCAAAANGSSTWISTWCCGGSPPATARPSRRPRKSWPCWTPTARRRGLHLQDPLPRPGRGERGARAGRVRLSVI
jgi:hypothetical protein